MGPVDIPAVITVRDLAELLSTTPIEVIKRLMVHGVMAAVNNTVEHDIAATVARELGGEVTLADDPESSDGSSIRPELAEGDIEKLETRPPVVTILGHVDHGKTSLLDAIRQTKVTEGEAGGITQHIGAYQVEYNGQPITFIDTPGHEAFTAMRARGARVTDIAVLVVAANDGVMPQTIEAINHIQAAGVPMIVAINKMDLESANPDRLKQQLTEHQVVVEEYGGDVVTVPVSAVTGDGISDLLEAIALVAEVSELRANPDRPAAGVIIEAELDTSRGAMATLLVQEGTFRRGDAFLVGETWGKAKAVFDDVGNPIEEAGPSTPIKIMGLSDVPVAGEQFSVVENEREARRLADQQARSERDADARGGLDAISSDVAAGNIKDLTVVLKTDVQGTAEALKASLEQVSNEEVQVRVIRAAAGPVSESDVMLAEVSSGIIIAFGVRTEPGAEKRAEAANVDIRNYDIIYNAIEDIEAASKGMLEPVYREVVVATAEVRQVFKSSRMGKILGCYITSGTAQRNAQARLKRGDQVVAKGRVTGLKRFQDDVREVQEGFECGVVIDSNDGEEGDILELFVDERVR